MQHKSTSCMHISDAVLPDFVAPWCHTFQTHAFGLANCVLQVAKDGYWLHVASLSDACVHIITASSQIDAAVPCTNLTGCLSPLLFQVDLYSFSMIMYQLFEHRPPFDGMDPAEAAFAAAIQAARPEFVQLAENSFPYNVRPSKTVCLGRGFSVLDLCHSKS